MMSPRADRGTGTGADPRGRALKALGGRLQDLGALGLRLDGRKVSLPQAIEAANDALRAAGAPPIRYPGIR